jgi:hypothetical protein
MRDTVHAERCVRVCMFISHSLHASCYMALFVPVLMLQTSNPDRASGIRPSIAEGSEMDEFAFTAALQQLLLLRCTADISLVHVPSQLCAMWKRFPHMEDSPASDTGASAHPAQATATAVQAASAHGAVADATTYAASTATTAAAEASAASAAAGSSLGAWLQSRRAQLQTTRYLAFHWSCGHFCSVLVDLDVWRARPMGKAAAAAAARPHTDTTHGIAALVKAVAVAAAAAAHASPTESAQGATSLPAKRRRQSSRALPEAQQDARSRCQLPVPLLHLDTLPSACGFLADRAELLRCLCVALNKLFDTQWPVRPMQQLRAHLHLCGPPMQTDTWSCGYRLLCGWAALLAVMRQTRSISPDGVSRACDDAEQQTSLSQMVEQARALYDDATS